MLDLDDLKKMQDKAYLHNQDTRERAADDAYFYWISNWDDSFLDQSNLRFRGEFNILRKAGRQINTDLSANEIQIDFMPKDESRTDGADILDGIYRADDRRNQSQESYKNARGEAIVCGYGAWELYTEWKTSRGGDEEQVIRRRPIYEANNNTFWDPNAKLQDKSDACYVTHIEPYSPEGYRELVKDLTGEDPGEVQPANFATPEQSYVYPWLGGNGDVVYVGCMYHREMVKDKVLSFEDPLGQPMKLRESDLKEDGIMDELIDSGYKIVDEKEIKRWQVTKYYASGEMIIASYPIAGEHIPIIPMYGERAFVEGEEHYEGITRLAKDPQRLRNFQLSYLADIVSRSPRPKPIFNPEQVQGFEFMYEESGADNDYPYYLQNRMDANGNPLPVGPIAEMPEQRMPQALAASIELSRQAVEDVANPGVPQDIADVDLSGKAVTALQRRIDDQSMVYQESLKHAKRRDAEVYASMATDIHDTPKMMTMTLPDGSKKQVQIMEMVQDRETGELVVLNDLTNMEFEVFADVGPTYTTKKQETIEQLGAIAQAVAAVDPNLMTALTLQQLTLMDGIALDDIREYANKQLVLRGFKEPQTEEELQMLQQAAQQQGQPDPNMLLAQAEMLKGQAQIAREQRETARDAAKAQNDQAQTQIDVFKAQTDRASVQIDAQKAGAQINYDNIRAFGQQLDNVAKTAAFRGRISPNPGTVQ